MSNENEEKTNGETKAVVKYSANAIVGTQSQLKDLLNTPSMQEAIRDLAPKHLKPEKLTRMILSAASRNPKILECTQASILKSAIEATMLGLDCSGLLGRGYMVPYRNNKINAYEAQFMPGYLGLVDLARRSGEIVDITATPVFDGDQFEYEEGLNRKLIHKPVCDPEQVREKQSLLWVYAVAEFTNGHKKFHVMPKAEVEKHRMRSKAKDSGPWVSDYIAMALKTVVRQLCKFLPQSVDLQSMLEKEYEIDSDDEFNMKYVKSQELNPTNGRQKFGFTEEQPAKPSEQAADSSNESTGPGAADEPAAGSVGQDEEPAEPAPDDSKDVAYICKRCEAVYEEQPEQCKCLSTQFEQVHFQEKAAAAKKANGKKKSA